MIALTYAVCVVCVYGCPSVYSLWCLCLWLPFDLLSVLSVLMISLTSTVCVSVLMISLTSTVCAFHVCDCPYIRCLCFPCLCLPSQLLSVLSVSVTALTSTVCDCLCICCLCIPRLWLPSPLLSVFSIPITVFIFSVSIYEYPFFYCLCLRVPSPLSVLFVSLCALTSLTVFSVPLILLSVFLCLCDPLQPALSVSMIALTYSVFTVSVYNCAQLSFIALVFVSSFIIPSVFLACPLIVSDGFASWSPCGTNLVQWGLFSGQQTYVGFASVAMVLRTESILKAIQIAPSLFERGLLTQTGDKNCKEILWISLIRILGPSKSSSHIESWVYVVCITKL